MTELRSHPRALEIYGSLHEEEDSLLESVRAQGILTPLLITADGLVIAGNERLRVARELGIQEVPVIVVDLCDPNEIEETLINSNVARQKTNEQRINEYDALKRIEAAKAADRKGARTDLMANSPAGETGAARDLAAAKIGWGGRKAEDGSKVVHAMAEQAKGGANMHTVQELYNTLNEKSVAAAYQKAVELGWIVAKESTAKKSRAASAPRIQAVYRKATSAAEQLVGIVTGQEIALLAPEHIRELRQTLEPLRQWIDALKPAAA